MRATRRPLTDEEQRCIRLARALDSLYEHRALTGRLFVPNESVVGALQRVYRVLACSWNQDKKAYVVTVSIDDYSHYVAVQMAKNGLCMLLDGSIVTDDGYLIEDDEE